ncbi:hypothetical protein HKX54_00530 [Sulfitobacter sp. M57]|uniref:hypothetical protein n=1 Tax=unclassified Sulfitobacter TaxID=196795 RepID=UPI0023E09795|nr:MULTISPECIES: hypothetical protein [unclassified Sulfitobacter]MDF3412928.1 hypothetical protein [Sulfitobacter sp. KE5]MDF3421788.1 hypothetical protein [Sulfitobacter sp. KE43]MDF3431477.1 hypothetical protein [Sulfitobacter sp. KE42]MDF3457118.1 hypothetical protein [Sulfitobacter sp. S74]MDF3461021.1 hypothetical protein [Sulfitobacter sp. Ks18]
MNDGTFTLNFLGQGTKHAADADEYRPYFLEYDPAKWAGETSGGAFKFVDPEGASHNCLILHSAEHGICLFFDKWDKKFIAGVATLGDENRLQETVDIGSDEIYPVGCFISPQQAWPLVESYLNTPTAFPQSPLLKDVNDIDWPAE